jgi:5-formyltetrahydrofolate cyclo-ligase
VGQTTLNTKLDVKTLRNQYRHKRRQLSPAQQIEAGEQALENCQQYSTLETADTIACYLANDGELDPSAIIHYAWKRQKRVVLPVIHPFSPGHLVFVQYTAHSPMFANRYGILEPKVTALNLCPLEQIQLIFTPLVAFDQTGNRLGMGGGYYDRTLAPIRRNHLAIELIGLAHPCQQALQLPNKPWDIALDGIATSQQYFAIG